MIIISNKWTNSYLKNLGAVCFIITNEPRSEKTGLRGFLRSPTQPGLHNYWTCLETCSFWLRKKRYCTIQGAKRKTLISIVVTAKLISVFLFVYAKSQFSHDATQIEIRKFIFRIVFMLWILFTPDSRQSQTIFYLQVNRSQLPNKAFSIAKATIVERKIDIFDCHYVDFGNRKRSFLQSETKTC